MRPQPKPKVVRDAAWLQVVRTMPCWCHRMLTREGILFTSCRPYDTIGGMSSANMSEASHLDGKSRDDRVLPMCGGCHRTGPVAWHRGQRTFCRHFCFTKAQLIAEAEALYAAFKAR